MVSKKLTVVNPSGLHLRPAGVLSQTAMKFKCDVIIECGEKKIVAKSVTARMKTRLWRLLPRQLKAVLERCNSNFS